MGFVTPNIGLYCPSNGESNYLDAFNAGMINLDQHDHTGGPNKGVPITSSGLGPFSVTYDKLNSNVVDLTTGIGVSGSLPNQLVMLGILKNLYTIASAAEVGFVTMNGQTVAARTFQNSSTATWTNADGSGNPSVAFNIAGVSPVGVANGGTGRTSLSAWDVITGGTTSTGAVQQVSGQGILNQYLGSNGAAAVPSWKTLPTIPPQTLFQSTITLTSAQFNALSGTPIEIVATPGAGKVIIPYSLYGKLNYGGVAFASGSEVKIIYSGLADVGFEFNEDAFKNTYIGYYYAENVQSASSTGKLFSLWENTKVSLTVGGSNYSGGAGSTVSFSLQYSIMEI